MTDGLWVGSAMGGAGQLEVGIGLGCCVCGGNTFEPVGEFTLPGPNPVEFRTTGTIPEVLADPWIS